jgi:hypothetical protein
MNNPTRREFLKRTAIAVAGTGALPLVSTSGGAARSNARLPHRSIIVPGVHAYADRESVTAGESIAFHISSTVPYRLTICRLGLAVDDPAGDQILHAFPRRQPQPQPIHPGSCVHVAKGIGKGLSAFTLECWVRPWRLKTKAGLIQQFDSKRGLGVAFFLNVSGGVSLLLGTRQRNAPIELASPDSVLKKARWHHLVATWTGESIALWIDGEPLAGARFAAPLSLPRHPIRIGALENNGVADHFLDGDMAMPAVYDTALSRTQIQERFQARALKLPEPEHLLGCWPFDEEGGDLVRDCSRHARHGQIVNHGTWMIGGPSFKAAVTRFATYDPAQDPRRGHALRFASDDLYDCGWKPAHQYRLPNDAKPGIYVGRIQYELEGQPHLYHVTFLVRRSPRRKRAPILVLASTHTWRAYSGTPFAKPAPDLKQVWGTGGFANSPGDPPAFNFYRGHAAGQGTYQIGLRMPWPAAGPYILYGGPTDYSHLARADRFLHIWLEKDGYDFDLIGDFDLHHDPEILNHYPVVVINGHSEYWSIPMYRGLERYLARGGNVICLSGNSLFWRVSYNETATILECRKVDAPGEQVPAAQRGESWHSHDGLRGGLMRECGFPGWKLIGLETLGWNNQGNPDQFGPYLVENADHFLFCKPVPCGLKNGEAFGQAPDGKMPRANGHEIDVRLSTLASLQNKPPPAGATMPADPPGIQRIANGIITWKIGGAAFDYFFRPVQPPTDQGGEMIYWERPEGGRVFNSGSIGTGWALLSDTKLQQLLRNVLFHFGVSKNG